jgi:hypothetical protein
MLLSGLQGVAWENLKRRKPNIKVVPQNYFSKSKRPCRYFYQSEIRQDDH